MYRTLCTITLLSTLAVSLSACGGLEYRTCKRAATRADYWEKQAQAWQNKAAELFADTSSGSSPEAICTKLEAARDYLNEADVYNSNALERAEVILEGCNLRDRSSVERTVEYHKERHEYFVEKITSSNKFMIKYRCRNDGLNNGPRGWSNRYLKDPYD